MNTEVSLMKLNIEQLNFLSQSFDFGSITRNKAADSKVKL